MHVRVVNKFFVEFRIVSYKKAIRALFLGVAKPLVDYDVFYSLDDWNSFAELDDKLNQRKIRTSSAVFYMPERIIYPKAGFPAADPKLTRKNLCLRDKWTCQYCGKVLELRNTTLDHVIPSSKGGKTVWNNAALACRVCNSRKSDKYLHESGLRLRCTPRVPSWFELADAVSKHYNKHSY